MVLHLLTLSNPSLLSSLHPSPPHSIPPHSFTPSLPSFTPSIPSSLFLPLLLTCNNHRQSHFSTITLSLCPTKSLFRYVLPPPLLACFLSMIISPYQFICPFFFASFFNRIYCIYCIIVELFVYIIILWELNFFILMYFILFIFSFSLFLV